MIISVFGPDGVGKSTVTQPLTDLGWCVFSGTGVANWPDQTWHQELTKAGIDETVIGTEDHLFEKIRRVHAMARELEKDQKVVVIDSDPFHKTLMHDYARALPDIKRAQQILEQRFTQLSNIANYEKAARIHVYIQISDVQDDLEQAKILQDRVHARGALAHFDPKSIDQSLASIKAYRAIKELLDTKNKQVITVTSSGPLDIQRFIQEIKALDN